MTGEKLENADAPIRVPSTRANRGPGKAVALAPEVIAPKRTFEQVMSGATGGSSGPAEFNLYDVDGALIGRMRGKARKVTDGRLGDLLRARRR